MQAVKICSVIAAGLLAAVDGGASGRNAGIDEDRPRPVHDLASLQVQGVNGRAPACVREPFWRHRRSMVRLCVVDELLERPDASGRFVVDLGPGKARLVGVYGTPGQAAVEAAVRGCLLVQLRKIGSCEARVAVRYGPG